VINLDGVFGTHRLDEAEVDRPHRQHRRAQCSQLDRQTPRLARLVHGYRGRERRLLPSEPGELMKGSAKPCSMGRSRAALVQMSAVKGRPEMTDVWPKRRDWRAGFGNCAPAGRRQHMFGHKEVRYGDNSYPSRS